MMHPITTFDGTATRVAAAAAPEMRHIVRQVLRLLDRLVPVRRDVSAADLSPEFFRYPPV